MPNSGVQRLKAYKKEKKKMKKKTKKKGGCK